MYDLLPNIKLIYLVRDPIERAVSHYIHNKISGRVSSPIDEALQPVEESFYFNTSKYYLRIKQYLNYYEPEEILVVQSEKLRSERAKVMKKVFRFIHVDENFYENNTFLKEHNKSPKDKSFIAKLIIGYEWGRRVKKYSKKGGS